MGTKRFLITEEDKKHILSLYEGITDTSFTVDQPEIILTSDKNEDMNIKFFKGTKFNVKDKSLLTTTTNYQQVNSAFGDIVRKERGEITYNCKRGKFNIVVDNKPREYYFATTYQFGPVRFTNTKNGLTTLCSNSSKIYEKNQTKKIGGGGSQNKSNNTQSVGVSNVINDEAWQNLFDKLSVKFNVKIDNKVTTPTQSKFFTIGNFTINRNGVPFIKLGQKGDAGYRSGAIIEKYNNQELDQFKIRVWQGDDQFMPLWVFLNLQTEPKVVDKPKVDSGKKYSGGGGTGNSVGMTYKDCTGSYIKGCKSETIKKVQGCLGLSADGKMGPNTVNVIKSKLGRTYFTDTDVNTLCNTSKSNEFDQDYGDSKNNQEPKQDVYQDFGGEEY